MSSIEQYTSLYNDNHSQLSAGCGPALNDMRHSAFEALQGQQLPDRDTEGFERTSIDEMFAPDYGVNINRLQLPCDVAAAFKCGVPNVSTLLAVMVNDRFTPSTAIVNNLPQGVTVMSLREASLRYPDQIKSYYGQCATLDSPGTALNTLLAQDGVYIHIDAGVNVSRPIQIVTLTSVPVPMLTVRRMLIVAERGANVSILLCDHTTTRDVTALTSQVVEVIAKADSHIDLCDIEETHQLQSRYNQVYVTQHDNSDVALTGMTLHNGTTRNEYRVSIEGTKCKCQLDGIAIGNGTQHIDNSSDVIHRAPHSTSHQLFKYVLDDEARGAFEGSIQVTQGAPHTEAYQSNRNILASTAARMHTKPQLLIYNDDVKCSHGATTGQLDDRALFYMQSRGIPLQQARMMLMQAFTAEVIDTVRVEAVRDRLRHLVERRLSGLDSHCNECSSTCQTIS